jgi:hypothetical protein
MRANAPADQKLNLRHLIAQLQALPERQHDRQTG